MEIRKSAQIKRNLNLKCASLGIPSSGIFELTPRCNLQCPMCYVRMNPEDMVSYGREYSAKEWLELAEQAKEAGMIFLLITGGEPMIRPDFVEIYEGLIQKGLSISINSNGTALRDEIKESLLRYPPAQVNITIYGTSREDYGRWCGNPAAYDNFMDAVRWFKENGILLHLNATITKDNYERWEEFEAFAKKENLELRMTTYCFPPARKEQGDEFKRLDPETAGELTVQDLLYREGIDAVQKRASQLGSPLNSCKLDIGDPIQCMAAKSQFWISWNGNMVPCGMLDNPVTKPFETGFQKAWEQLKEMTSNIRLCPDCTACPDKQSCMNCAAVTYTETGRFDGKPEYTCRMNQSYRKSLKKYAGLLEEQLENVTKPAVY